MALNKFEKLWKLMSSYNFETVDCLTQECLCFLCQKLIIEPYTSMCGCHFCGECIKKYISERGGICPGTSEECKNVLLEIGKNVLIDFTTQFNIAKVNVKCPYVQCSQIFELTMMEDHIRFCNMRPMNCPYQCLGCEDCGVISMTVREHLLSDIFDHSKLLIEAFNNLKNDFDVSVISKTESEYLKVEMDNKAKEEMCKFVEMIKAKEEELNNLKREIENIKDKSVSKIEFQNFWKENEKYKLEMEQFKKQFLKFKDSENKKSNDASISVDFDEINKISDKFLKIEDFAKEMTEKNKLINVLKDENQECKDRIKSLEILVKQMSLSLKTDFLWTIPSFSKKKVPFDSDNFTKDYYKFSCSLLLEGSSFRFEIRIMKGELDDLLQWPMKLICYLGIVNQECMVVNKCFKISYSTIAGDKAVFGRPIIDCNNSIGGFSISSKELKATPGFLVNDTLILCCSFNSKLK